MVKRETFEVYDYPIEHVDGTIYEGSYTIRKGIKPLGYPGEHLVERFTTNIKFTNY